jgi:hypothetical protein
MNNSIISWLYLMLEMLSLDFETLVVVFLLRILNNGPIGYYMFELEAQVATLICLVIFLVPILEKIKDSIWLFSPWKGGIFGYSSCNQCVNNGYFNFDKV